MDGSRARAEAPSTEPSAKLFCCGCVRRYLPLVYREEIYHILRMTGPLVAFRILNYLLPFVITMFCGRLGNSVLAGYGMASATISITTAATGGGLALACDTLVSQTFGSKNLLHVGVILQRGVLILLLFCLPCWALLINTQPLLLLLGQDPEVLCFSTAQASFLHQLQVAYLQNQGVILPQVYTAIAANIANVLTNYILITWLDFGVYGSAVANAVAEIYICVFLYAYIRWKRLHSETWGGWSLESLQDWGAYMKLAIPSTMMLCFEWWIYEIGGFLAGMLSEMDLAAQHAVLMLATTNYMFNLGMQGATCVRVGNALGAGDTTAAVLTCKVSLTLTALLAVVQGAVLAGFWLGLLICVCIQSTFFIVVIFRLNWERVTKEAIERSGKSNLNRRQLDFEGDPSQSVVPANYTSQNSEASVIELTCNREQSKVRLSTSQLIIRRGLTTLAAVLILATGTSLHLTLPLPEVSKVTEANDTLNLNSTLQYATPSLQTSGVNQSEINYL
uniref:Multidrug and toxin extrusion protein n=1 Tax=Astyanax mexicanus TaxID=7994 RepID=A0A8B9HMJ4_ASTMX